MARRHELERIFARSWLFVGQVPDQTLLPRALSIFF